MPCSFQHPSLSHAVAIIVDMRFERDLKITVAQSDGTTDMQVIRLTHRPTGFNGRRCYFVSEKGERAETLFLVDGRFRTRREAGLTYPSQSIGELDRVLEQRRKLEAQLKGTKEDPQGDADASRPRRDWRKLSAP